MINGCTGIHELHRVSDAKTLTIADHRNSGSRIAQNSAGQPSETRLKGVLTPRLQNLLIYLGKHAVIHRIYRDKVARLGRALGDKLLGLVYVPDTQ
ncbi:hypothetical protein LBMAG20_15780 [Methylocystaceae bacterium]|nr:hypothetical protein LBMAG20_15780 [Methylocystaceae bacterium]